MLSSFKSFFTSSASKEQVGPVSPAILITTETGESSSELVEPSSTNRTPSFERPMPAQSNPTLMTAPSNDWRPSEASTNTASPADSAWTSSSQQTTSNAPSAAPPTVQDSPRAQPSHDINCMVFDSNSYVGSPTFNMDSEDATGATFSFPEHGFRPQRPPSARVYLPQTSHAVRREGVMYFGPGSDVGSPTFNIRSARASGTVEQVVPSRS
ncbi:uncharacterized protein EDB91DRAFT_138073 [Suillus paluster]|uniref:uncharacterized protein n=1 Tax=Suillus paluster TaxID=48578 RepID=UPI001B85BC7F|nr:uncharacterized protein EDB91DRAFT_138073 [Suillus paluster]KAG1746009.1 hypothetical protein EDB91DRAFT_138073 [Suillus paluster]